MNKLIHSLDAVCVYWNGYHFSMLTQTSMAQFNDLQKNRKCYFRQVKHLIA